MKRNAYITNLRAIGCLLVMFSHWGVVFFTNPDVASSLGVFGNTTYTDNCYFSKVLKNIEFINFGMIGVSLFFLITGFLTPQSIEKYKKKYLSNRLIRIFPTYIVGLIFTVLVIYGSSLINNVVFPYKIDTILKNMTLLRLWFWAPSIDGVSWTLECQLFFSIICYVGVIGRISSDKSIPIFLMISSLYVFLNSRYFDLWIEINFKEYIFFYASDFMLTFSAFIIIGYIISLSSIKNLGGWKTILYISIAFICFGIDIKCLFPNDFGVYFLNYMIGITIFCLFYLYRDKISEVSFFNRVAAISYPFYIVHGAAGYSLLYIFKDRLGSWCLSFIITIFIIVGVSVLLHRLVELPCVRFKG